jgi:hypothetical protein
MHLGNFLSDELKKQGKSIADVAKLVNKTDTGVRKDLGKDNLHQSVIETYSKVLGVNIFRVLADDYEGISYPNIEEKPNPQVGDTERQKLEKPEKIEVMSVNISIPADKREAFLNLLLS